MIRIRLKDGSVHDTDRYDYMHAINLWHNDDRFEVGGDEEDTDHGVELTRRRAFAGSEVVEVVEL
ncbi:MAG: hypothetical protein ABW022_03220 [Actinoplanes sp.]